ncbi:MAG: RnfABCDGE type electron transport complex subunit D [Bacilli bacterium]|nr:RnfABCDGE type electron transport complex subunit D [Bacilli bacterium]MBN2876367.1 RnfABCDGE type electron transport complex subunit D [Bacilli bacterium]
MARFANGKAPYLRMADQDNKGTGIIMRDFLIGLMPVILFAWYKNGIAVFMDGNTTFFGMLYPLFFILAGAVSSMLMEAVFFFFTDPEARTLPSLMKKLSLSYAIIPGLILALMLPMYTPIWVLMFGTFIGNIVGKMIFGGFGHNIWNPALLGYAVIKFTFMGLINASGGYFNPSEMIALYDATAGSTPLVVLSSSPFSYDSIVAPFGNLWTFFVGMTPGGMGETSVMVMLVSYLWLSFRKVIKWTTPLIYVGAVFGLSWIVGALNGDAGLWFPVYSILSGGLMYGAVFMITEPVTTPKNPLGKIYFALMLAVLTVLFRFVGSLPEGVGTSIIVMNIFALPIDKYTAIIRANRWRKPAWFKIATLAVILIAIGLYAVIKAGNVYTDIILPILPFGGVM